METKKCPYCGEEILATAKKCKHCGEWLDKESTAPVTNMVESSLLEDPLQQGKKAEKKRNNMVVILGIIIGVIGISLVVYYLTTGSSMERDARKMAKIHYGIATYELTDEKGIEKNEKFLDECANKYDNKEQEFKFLYYGAMIELSLEKKNWDMSILTLKEYIGDLENNIDEMPLSKAGERIKKAENYISTLNNMKSNLTPDEIEHLRNIEDDLRNIKESDVFQ